MCSVCWIQTPKQVFFAQRMCFFNLSRVINRGPISVEDENVAPATDAVFQHSWRLFNELMDAKAFASSSALTGKFCSTSAPGISEAGFRWSLSSKCNQSRLAVTEPDLSNNTAQWRGTAPPTIISPVSTSAELGEKLYSTLAFIVSLTLSIFFQSQMPRISGSHLHIPGGRQLQIGGVDVSAPGS